MLLLAATNQLMLDGFEAWAGVLGGGTAFATGLVALLVANAGGEGDYLADHINKALGRGFLYGLIVGAFVYGAHVLPAAPREDNTV